MSTLAVLGLLCAFSAGSSAFPGAAWNCDARPFAGSGAGLSCGTDAPAPWASAAAPEAAALPRPAAEAFHLFSPGDTWGFMAEKKSDLDDTPTPLPQNDDGTLLMNKAYWSNFVLDPVRAFKSPATWGRRAWIEAALIAGTTFALYTLDEHIQRWSQEHRSSTSDTVSKWAKPLGNGFYTIPALAGFYLIGRTSDNTRAQETALLGFESLVLTGAATEVLKHSAGRGQPGQSPADDSFHGPSFSGAYDSFPSGHASSAFSFATIIALEYRDHAWVPPLAYGLATLTGLSRINDNAHWSSDVFLGAVLGYSVSRFLYHEHHVRNRNELTLTPYIDRDRRGIMLNYAF